MLEAAKIESDLSKFPDSSCQNIDQVNLLVEFLRENNSNKNVNCSHNSQNISSQLIFERMILNHFHIYASNYWKLGKIWVMIELKNPTLNFISVWVHHSKLWYSTNWEKNSFISAFYLLDLPWLSQLYCLDNSVANLAMFDSSESGKKICYKQTNWAQFYRRDKIC